MTELACLRRGGVSAEAQGPSGTWEPEQRRLDASGFSRKDLAFASRFVLPVREGWVANRFIASLLAMRIGALVDN